MKLSVETSMGLPSEGPPAFSEKCVIRAILYDPFYLTSPESQIKIVWLQWFSTPSNHLYLISFIIFGSLGSCSLSEYYNHKSEFYQNRRDRGWV